MMLRGESGALICIDLGVDFFNHGIGNDTFYL